MDEDNFNDFFDFEEDPDYDPQEAKREWRAEEERVNNLPILKKAQEIYETTNAIVGTINEEEDVLEIRHLMLENAMIIPAKIHGAEGGGLYTLRMENAVIIKIAARELLTQTSFCKTENLLNNDYLNLLRSEIEEFRVLFIEWVNGFDKSDDIPDDWGLFY